MKFFHTITKVFTATATDSIQFKKARQCPDKPGSVSFHDWKELCHLSTLQVTLHL